MHIYNMIQHTTDSICNYRSAVDVEITRDVSVKPNTLRDHTVVVRCKQ